MRIRRRSSVDNLKPRMRSMFVASAVIVLRLRLRSESPVARPEDGDMCCGPGAPVWVQTHIETICASDAGLSSDAQKLSSLSGGVSPWTDNAPHRPAASSRTIGAQAGNATSARPSRAQLRDGRAGPSARHESDATLSESFLQPWHVSEQQPAASLASAL